MSNTKIRPNITGNVKAMALALAMTWAAFAFGQDLKWNFRNDADVEAWKSQGRDASGIEIVGSKDGALECKATGHHVYLFSPPGLAVDASKQKFIRIRLKVAKGLANNACFHWIGKDAPKWSDDQMAYFQVSTDGEWRTYEVDLSKKPNWQGTITQLRFSPFYIEKPLPEDQQTFWIEFIQISDKFKD